VLLSVNPAEVSLATFSSVKAALTYHIALRI